MKRLAVDLLKVFYRARNQPLDASELMRLSNWRVGTMYTSLVALEDSGLLSSKWEDRFATFPRRRIYEMTEAGRTMAVSLIEKEGI